MGLDAREAKGRLRTLIPNAVLAELRCNLVGKERGEGVTTVFPTSLLRGKFTEGTNWRGYAEVDDT